MKINKIWAIYFSPVGTTEKVASSIAKELSFNLGATVEKYDFTLPQARMSFPQVGSDDLVVFATPTYAGRVPNVLLKYLDTVVGNGALAVPVVTFGNRSFDNSLIELRDILEKDGFKTVSGAACACQHSFSHSLGMNRPDADDLAEIEQFAMKLAIMISRADGVEQKKAVDSGSDGAAGEALYIAAEARLVAVEETCDTQNKLISPIEVDGIPETYGGYYKPQDRHGNHIDIRKVTPKVGKACIECGLCARVCPMGSISHDDVREMTGICIKCNACYKKCPQSARYFDDEGYIYHKEELEAMYKRRAENKFFL